MSVKAEKEIQVSPEKPPKRKRADEDPELEIDLNAPEPPSKKALRKSKKQKTTPTTSSISKAESKKTDDDPKTTEQSSDPAQPPSSESKESSTKRSQFGIWVGNLSFTTTKDDLTTFLSNNSISSSGVTRIHLPLGQPKFGKPQNKGFAYIDFADSTTHQLALRLTESLLGGRRILLKDAKNFEGRPQNDSDTKTNISGKAPNQRIFVGNLGFDTTVEDLEKHFGVCGAIGNVHMATFEDTGKCKGFAWIEFEELSAAEAAMCGWISSGGGKTAERSRGKDKDRTYLHKMNGRQLRLEYAEDKTTRYNKRYGKGAKLPTGDSEHGEQDAIEEVQEDKQDASSKRQREGHRGKQNKPSEKKGKTSRYDADVVNRLTGSIVESAGQKTVFE